MYSELSSSSNSFLISVNRASICCGDRIWDPCLVRQGWSRDCWLGSWNNQAWKRWQKHRALTSSLQTPWASKTKTNDLISTRRVWVTSSKGEVSPLQHSLHTFWFPKRCTVELEFSRPFDDLPYISPGFIRVAKERTLARLPDVQQCNDFTPQTMHQAAAPLHPSVPLSHQQKIPKPICPADKACHSPATHY